MGSWSTYPLRISRLRELGYAETTRAIDGLRQRVFKHKDVE